MMPINYNILEDQLTPESIFDYDREVNTRTYDLEGLFDYKTIQGKWYDFTQNRGNKVMVSRYHPLNAPTDLVSRPQIEVSRAQLAYTKIEIGLDEDDLLNFTAPRTDAEFEMAQRKIYDDSSNLLTSVREKREFQRAQILSTGHLKVNENGYVADFDFGIPKENFIEFDWTKSKSKIQDIMGVVDQLANNDDRVSPSTMIMSPEIVSAILLDEEFRSVLATYNNVNYITQADVNAWLSRMGLPAIYKYDRSFYVPDSTLSTGTDERPMAGKIIFIPGGSLGDRVNGTTPEEAARITDGVQTAKQDDIVLQRFAKHDPEAEYVKAASRFFHTISVPKQIAIVDVKLS